MFVPTMKTPGFVFVLVVVLLVMGLDGTVSSATDKICSNFDEDTKQCKEASSTSTTTLLYEQRLQQQQQHRQHHQLEQQQQYQQYHPLKPSDLPLTPILFDNFNGTTTVTIPVPASSTFNHNYNNRNNNRNYHNNNNNNNQDTVADITVRPGEILQQGRVADTAAKSSKVAYLPELIPRSVIGQVLTILRGHENMTIAHGRTTVSLDQEPDSVDGMTSQEIFLDNDSLRAGMPSKGGDSGAPPENMEERHELRQQIIRLLEPYQTQLTEFLQHWFEECPNNTKNNNNRHNNNYNNNNHPRKCTPCYSLIRRYRSGERQSHAPHNDAHSLVTVVVSLSDYDTEYRGGLYVSSKTSERHYFKLNRGDAVAHQGDLHHGVNVLDTTADETTKSERWSWIMWYRDSTTCQDYSQNWYTGCSERGSPICMYLRANSEATKERVIHWNKKASQAGHAQASVKLGYAYLKALSSDLPFDMDIATQYFQKSIEASNEPDGHYGLATVYLAQAKISAMDAQQQQQYNRNNIQQPNMAAAMAVAQDDVRVSSLVSKAIYHLEEAAKCGHVFAMFNLGTAHLYGYGRDDGHRDPKLAAEWYTISKLPEGLYARSLYESSLGHSRRARQYQQQAHIMGYGTPWRQLARQRTGSGGSSGANLNLKWPPISLPNNNNNNNNNNLQTGEGREPQTPPEW